MKFSYYKAPVKNTVPYRDIDLQQLYNLVTGPYLVKVTEEVRTASDYKTAKATMLPYITPGGTFRRRHSDEVISLSGLISFDFDHLADLTASSDAITNFEGVEFIYTSPSAEGLKVIIRNPYQCDSYSEEFERLKKLIKEKTGLVADNTPDVARACFVCHDPKAWIKPKSNLEKMIEKNPAVQMLIDSLDLITLN